MAPRWLCRLAVFATLTLAAVIPSGTAMADDTVALEGPFPVTAREAAEKGPACTDWATGPNADQDLWRFETDGRVVAIELHFTDQEERPQVRETDAAWVATPGGWTLVGGEATVTGGETFTLAHTCPAMTQPLIARAVRVPVEPGTALTALAGGTNVGATVTLGSTLVLAGVLLLIVRRHPRGRHRAPRGYDPTDDIRHPIIEAPR